MEFVRMGLVVERMKNSSKNIHAFNYETCFNKFHAPLTPPASVPELIITSSNSQQNLTSCTSHSTQPSTFQVDYIHNTFQHFLPCIDTLHKPYPLRDTLRHSSLFCPVVHSHNHKVLSRWQSVSHLIQMVRYGGQSHAYRYNGCSQEWLRIEPRLQLGFLHRHWCPSVLFR